MVEEIRVEKVSPVVIHCCKVLGFQLLNAKILLKFSPSFIEITEEQFLFGVIESSNFAFIEIVSWQTTEDNLKLGFDIRTCCILL